ncbi:hypothetical protein Tco_1318967 [Tanacetum coccineum]
MDPEDSLIMGDENLSTIPEKESDEFINSSVEDIVPIPCESDDTSDSDKECDLPFCYNFVTFSNPLFDANECFDPGGDIDEIDVFLEIDDSFPSLPDYDAFYFDDDHIEEKSSGSITTHSDFSLPEYDLFNFDLLINPYPPADRREFTRVLEENIFDLSTKGSTINELNDYSLLLSDCDSSLSKEFSEIDLLVSFPSGNEDMIFDPGIFIIKRVQSKRFQFFPLDDFPTFSFISDSLFLIDPFEIKTFLSFPSENKDKVKMIEDDAKTEKKQEEKDTWSILIGGSEIWQLGNPCDIGSLSPLLFTGKKKKVKSQTVTSTLPQSQGPEASGTLPQKRKNPKFKKPPTETKGTRKSQPFPKGTTTNPKDSRGNVQPADKGLSSTASNEGTTKTTPHLEGTLRDKDLEENKTPAGMEPINLNVAHPSGTGSKYHVDETQSTRLRYQTLTENKGKTSSEVEPDHKTLQLTTLADIQAYLLSEDELAQESDEEEPDPSHTPETQVSDSDSSSPDVNKFDNTLPLTERQLVKYLRKVSRVIFHRINEEQWAPHAEADVSYADLKASIEGYYEENVDHKEQTNKLDSVKDDPALNKKVIEATEAYTKNSTALSELLSLASTPSSSVPQTTLAITERPANVGGENDTQADTEEPHSHTKGEHVAMEDDTKKPESDKAKEETTRAVPISTIIPTTRPNPKAIATDDQPDIQTKLVPASTKVRPDPDAPILIKKATKEAKMFKMTKTKVIKVVQEEAEKIELDLKKIISAKAGEKFKKAQDAEHQVLKRQHTKKIKRLTKLNKKRPEQYMWTMSNKLKPELIIYVKIHPNSKPTVLTMYRNNDKRNFDVHNPFKFGDFGITELIELGLIIEKEKNSIVKDLMTSLGKRYKRLKKIPEELGIQSTLPAPIPEQALSQSIRRKRKHMELEPEIKVLGLECNRSLPKGHNMVIEEPEY